LTYSAPLSGIAARKCSIRHAIRRSTVSKSVVIFFEKQILEGKGLGRAETGGKGVEQS
jgi:hypothetical protein